MRNWQVVLAGLAFVGVVISDTRAQQPSSDILKRLEAVEKRLDEKDQIIKAQEEKIKQQDEKIEQQNKIIESLQKQGVGPASVNTLTPKQEQQVEQLVEQYLNKEEVRVGLGLEQVIAGYKDGFFLASRDQSYKMKFTGYIQVDGRFPATVPTADTFMVRRARPTVEGTLGKYYNFKVQPDFGEGKTVLKDAYIELAYFNPDMTTRLGKFKVPQSLEQLTSSSDIKFVERSLLTNIMPDRDVGVVAYGTPNLFGGILDYSFGIWNGNDRAEWSDKGKDSDVDNNDAKDFGGRIQLNPWKNTDNFWLKGLQFAGWFNYGQQEDAYKLGSGKSVVTYKTGPGTTFFKTYAGSSTVYAVRQDGERTRAGYDVAWLVGPVAITHDFAVMNTELSRQDVQNGPFYRDNIPTVAWQIGASWMITGEDASLKNPKPKNNFDFKKGTWGAFEVGARYSWIQVDGTIFNGPVSSSREGFAAAGSTNRASELTLGLNWYLNPNVKLMFDWTHTSFYQPISVGSVTTVGGARSDVHDEDAFMFRTQVKW